MVLRGCNPIVNDEIVDFNSLEKFLHYCFYKNLHINPEEHGIILVEQPLTPKSQREKLCEILFETFKIPALLLLDIALADLLSTGRKFGLVVRLANPTYIIPVWDSITLSSFVKKIPLGIPDVIEYLGRALKRAGHAFVTSGERQILRDIREKLCYVALNPDKESCNKSYLLPDGETLNLENELFMAPEIYFKPELAGMDKKIKPLDVEVFDTLMKLDKDLRKDLASNIILSGSRINGMKERLQKELSKLATFPIKIAQAELYSSWLGSSILGTLKNIAYPSKYWITRKEYYEKGMSIIHSKLGLKNF